ncbi:hypothetical protein ONS95_005444 [Cadophora gregata]|uniref:uncharacterized protein n=1 Tax=Cadophora gregata TaxID=51156 RepID=UPI0026DD1B0A|nr:uncharacterized protein ONS95_005444 [Cadophora gregata]KAK0103420.1 hypothetical protein ONS95_005444 [Cadophora gregata]KAK0107608.1 hypothetical protein ONS96_003414 [Cadophora gregata f. sp. sojae]
MITEGMSRVGNGAKIKGSLLGLGRLQWARQMLPTKGLYGSGSSAFNFTPTGDDDSLKLTMKAVVNGYGYGISIAVVVSIIVLLTYSGIALASVTYTVMFSHITSGAWDSVTELVALAINSDPSAGLKNTGAGISCSRTLERVVKVCARGDQLQLVFGAEDLEDVRGETSTATPNNYYA